MVRGRLAGMRRRLLRKDPSARLVIARTVRSRWSRAMRTRIGARRQPCVSGTRSLEVNGCGGGGSNGERRPDPQGARPGRPPG